MTGTTRSSADLDPRRRRILVRAWRRGIREMDLVIGGFADAEIGSLSEADLDELERIMGEDDADLLSWVTGEKPVPERFDQAFFARLRAHVPDFSPLAAEAGANDSGSNDSGKRTGAGKP